MYNPSINWKTLFAYETAMRSFSSTAQISFDLNALDQINHIDVSDAPSVQFMKMRDSKALAYRKYESLSSTALILIHGSACFGDHFHHLAKELSRSNLAEVYTLNLRGHGHTSGPRGADVNHPTQLVEDIQDFIITLKGSSPDKSIILGGHSAGGGIVLGFSQTNAAQLVDGFIFLAPFLGLGSETVKPYFGGWLKTFNGARIRMLAILNLFGVRIFNHIEVVSFNDDVFKGDPRYIKTWSFNTVLAFGPGIWSPVEPPLPASKPVLVLAGDKDNCFNQDLYPQAFQQIAPHAAIPQLGPFGHFDLLIHRSTLQVLSQWMTQFQKQTSKKTAS